MRRREFLGLLGSAAIAWPVAAQQPSAKMPRIGYLTERVSPGEFDEAFLRGLHELGYVEGRTIAIEYRWAEGKAERLPALAAELVALTVDPNCDGRVVRMPSGMGSSRASPIRAGTSQGSPCMPPSSPGNGLSCLKRPCRAYPAWPLCGMRAISPIAASCKRQ